jgi:hypothetical protein
MSGGPARVAVIGSGDLARAHARVAVAHPDLRLVALVSADQRAAMALAEMVVLRLEGERPAVFPDLERTLASVDVDIVAVGEAEISAAEALGLGKPVVGGVAPADGTGPWFSFESGPYAGTDGDAAFASHLRQYESVLGRLGFGPSAEAVRVSA